MGMLRADQSRNKSGARSSQAPAGLLPRLRLFGMLAVLGPLFAGLNVLVIESVPQVEIRFVAAESTADAVEPVVVERVVERVVYVPVDNLSAPAPIAAPADQARMPAPVSEAASAPVTVEPSDDAATAPITDLRQETAAVAVAAAPVWRAPARPVSAVIQPAPAEEDVSVAQPTEDEDPINAEAPAEAEESVAASGPRMIVVHTMVWDGEQFVESADAPVTLIAAPAEADSAVAVEPEAAVDTSDGSELADALDDAVEQLAEAGAAMSSDEDADQSARVAETEDAPAHGEPEGTVLAASGDDPADSTDSADDPEQVATADARPAQDSDAPDEAEQFAKNADEPERAAEDIEQAGEVADSADGSDQLAENGDEAEQIGAAGDQAPEVDEAAEATPDDDAATRARRQNEDPNVVTGSSD